MDNYIMFEGKKIPLTEEQIKMLKSEKESPFKRQKVGKRYYYVGGSGNVFYQDELGNGTDYNLFKAGNYCTDKNLMHQRAMHETLDRLLWRFSMENGEMDNPWGGDCPHYFIICDAGTQNFSVYYSYCTKESFPYFNNSGTAWRAIDEIIKPFMAEHPNFVW